MKKMSEELWKPLRQYLSMDAVGEQGVENAGELENGSNVINGSPQEAGERGTRTREIQNWRLNY